jgi:serine/threonine protein kinase
MELVEGPTLADRLRQGPIPLEEALLIAKQVAEALEYAPGFSWVGSVSRPDRR